MAFVLRHVHQSFTLRVSIDPRALWLVKDARILSRSLSSVLLLEASRIFFLSLEPRQMFTMFLSWPNMTDTCNSFWKLKWMTSPTSPYLLVQYFARSRIGSPRRFPRRINPRIFNVHSSRICLFDQRHVLNNE